MKGFDQINAGMSDKQQWLRSACIKKGSNYIMNCLVCAQQIIIKNPYQRLSPSRGYNQKMQMQSNSDADVI